MSAELRESLVIPQPHGDPIEIPNQYGAIEQYQGATELLATESGDKPVPAHLLANVVSSALSKVIRVKEIAAIARDFSAADEIVREVPSTPIIYRLHCTDAVGITPENGTTGFKQVDTNKENGSYSHYQSGVLTARQVKIWSGFNYEDEQVIEDADLLMYQPLSFLTSGNREAVERFTTHRPDWMRYPNSHVVVGQQAVTAFLALQAKKDLLGEDGRIKPEGIKNSWAMLASAGLKKLGYDSPIGKHGDIVHQTGLEGLVDIVASGLGHESKTVDTYTGDDGMTLRRLAGIDFDLRQDAQIVGKRASERIFSDKDRAGRFQGLLYGDASHVEAYLTETAGNFMSHVLGTEKPAVS